MNLNEIRLKGVDWIKVAQDSTSGWMFVYYDGFGVIKCGVFLNCF
jgi:hypothetical protein